MKYKKNQIVRMYGTGDGKGTFWIGAKGRVVSHDKEWDVYTIAPLEFPNERHPMHSKQLRKVRM